MRVALAASASLFVAACATAPDTVHPGASSEAVCWWQDVRWEDGAPLLAPGTSQPLGRALARGTPERWEGARVSGVLQPAAGGVRFLGTWRGAGLTLHADVEASRQAFLRAWAPTRLGPAGLVLPGGAVRVLDARDGELLVAPSLEAVKTFEPAGPEVARLSCDAVTLLAPPAGPQTKALEVAFLPRAQRVQATDSARGSVVGAFVARSGPTVGVVLERDGDTTRFAASDAQGTRWVGWVPAEALTPGPAPPEEDFTAAPSALPRRLAERACPRALPVSVQVDGVVLAAGRLEAQVPFALEREATHGVVVSPAVPWLQLAEGVALLLPLEAAACPRATGAAPGPAGE